MRAACWAALATMLAALPCAADEVPATAAPPSPPVASPAPPWPMPPRVYLPNKPELEPRAVELLQAMSRRLAAARTLAFTSVATYESPARTGQPLAYTVKSEVTLERPDRLRVVTLGDGPRSEFLYDGKRVLAYAPESGLVAVADAPPTIDGMLEAAYRFAAIYFPFTDVIVADPWGDLKDKLKLAFVVGQSEVVGDTRTDIVAIADDQAQVQIWIGAEDRLPRMIRATFFDEPGNYRHVAELSHWRLDEPVPPGSFTSEQARKAKQIPFAPPGGS